MPADHIATNSQVKELLAIGIAMVAGLIARTLVSDEPFQLRRFIGEIILAVMFGVAIFAVGIIQGMGFWQTMLVALLSGMGTTRSLEWLIKASKITRGQG